MSPQAMPRNQKPRNAKAALYLLCAALLAMLSGCSVNPATGRSEVIFMTTGEEIALGQRMHQLILDQQPAYNDPALQQYIDFVGQTLAAKSDRPLLPWHFTIIDSPDVNAFALPGGYIYINRGLLAYLQSEAELAAVLGHEIAHVTARHQARQQRNRTLTSIAGWIVAVGTGIGMAGDLTNIAGTAAISGYGRNLELEADRLGAGYMARVNYDHEAMLDVIGVLKDHQQFSSGIAKAEGGDGNTYHGVFSSHPKNDKRLQEVVRAAAELGNNGKSERYEAEYAKRINGMVYGDNVDQGVLRNNTFYHGPLDLSFSVPEDYRTKNGRSAVLMIAPEGNAGIIMSRTARDDKMSASVFVTKKLKLKGLRDGREFTSHGLSGYRARHSKGLIAVIYKDSGAYIFSGQIKKGTTRAGFESEFDQVVHSFHRLSTPEEKNIRPWQIRYWTVAPGWTYARLATISPLGKYAEAQLRLLNGDYPDGELHSGRRIRIIE